MAYVPNNVQVYAAAYAGAIAGIGIPSGAFITDPTSSDYAPITVVATAFAQAFDTAWGVAGANLYDIQAITDAVCNTFVKGSGAPLTGTVTTPANWTITATAIVALIKEGDANSGGIPFPTDGGSPFPLKSHILAASPVFGSDTTGDGSLYNPYATIAKCYSIASVTASASEIWEVILLPGDFVENVALRPFINLYGWESSDIQNSFYPARITGNITLHSSFTSNSLLGVTNVDLDGTVTLNFAALVSTLCTLSFTNCQFETAVTISGGDATVINSIEMHNCTALGEVTLTGGDLKCWNTNGVGPNTLSIQGVVNTATTFEAWDGVWSGDFVADASLMAGTDTLTVGLHNFSVATSCSVVSSATVNPTVVNDLGSLLENVSLVGAAAGLSPQMRVFHQFTIPSGTAIAGTGVTPIALTVPAALLGTTSIEGLINVADCIGTNWTAVFDTQNCSVSWQFVKNGSNNQVIAKVYNPGAGFNTAANLLVTWWGYMLPTPS